MIAISPFLSSFINSHSIYPLPNNIMPAAKQEEPESFAGCFDKVKKYINRIRYSYWSS